LLRRCVDFDPAFAELEPACDLLTDYYIDTRYPMIGVAYDQELATEAIELASQVVAFVGERIIP